MTTQQKISAEHKNVYAAICAAQLEFGTVTKGSVNPAFKSRYADLADVAGVVIPTLARHGVCVVQYFIGDSLDVMRTEFIHADSETKLSCDVPLIVEKRNMQGMKSATTYAKRIGLESLSGVAPEDDDGNAASAAAPQNTRPERQQSGPSHEAIDAAKDSLTNADTLDQLKAIWSDLPRAVQEAAPVIEAKNARKAALDDPILADEVPY